VGPPYVVKQSMYASLVSFVHEHAGGLIPSAIKVFNLDAIYKGRFFLRVPIAVLGSSGLFTWAASLDCSWPRWRRCASCMPPISSSLFSLIMVGGTVMATWRHPFLVAEDHGVCIQKAGPKFGGTYGVRWLNLTFFPQFLLGYLDDTPLSLLSPMNFRY